MSKQKVKDLDAQIESLLEEKVGLEWERDGLQVAIDELDEEIVLLENEAYNLEQAIEDGEVNDEGEAEVLH